MTRKSFVAAAVAATLAAGAAEAGSTAEPVPVLPRAETAAFAAEVERSLAAERAQVALVGRLGQPRADLPEGVSYTHVAFWVYSDVTRADGRKGRGYVAHNLYQRADDPDRSTLVRDLPADFFAGVTELDAGVVVPDPRLQARLLEVVGSPGEVLLHNPSYSLIANPYRDLHQNCTAHTLNVLMAALYGTDDMARIKANTRAHFAAQQIEVGPVGRLLGPVLRAGVAMDDQDGGAPRTATFDAIARFMDRFDLADGAYRLTPAGRVAIDP